MKHLRPQHSHGIGPLFDALSWSNRGDHNGPVKDESYPDAPGYKRDGTSKDAAEEVNNIAETLRDMCFLCLRIHDSTADEVAEWCKKSVLAVRPRLSELVARGKIEDSGVRRKNVSGKSAIVWRAK